MLLEALTDANMTDPNGQPLFPASKIKIELNGVAAINGPSGEFTIPLGVPVLGISTPMGNEEYFSGYAPDGTELALVSVAIPFVVYCNDGTADAVIKQRLTFARDRRKAVFSAHNLYLLGSNTDHLADFLKPEGLYQRNYVWHFLWSRSSG